MSQTPYATRKARLEAQIIQQVQEQGGFTVYWATDTQARAKAITRLEKRGIIVARAGKAYGRYRWRDYRVSMLHPNIKHIKRQLEKFMEAPAFLGGLDCTTYYTPFFKRYLKSIHP